VNPIDYSKDINELERINDRTFEDILKDYGISDINGYNSR
jgi:hypothetical protein